MTQFRKEFLDFHIESFSNFQIKMNYEQIISIFKRLLQRVG